MSLLLSGGKEVACANHQKFLAARRCHKFQPLLMYLYIERLNGPLFQIHGSIIRAIETDVELIGYLGVLSACIFPVRTATRLKSARELQQKLVLWNIYRPNVLQ